jgi:hypothetical protein
MVNSVKCILSILALPVLALVCSTSNAQNSVITQPGTVVGSLTGQNWISNSATTLYTVPAGKTARVTDVIVWGGDVAPGRTCSIALYCDTSSGSNLVYFMADAGKSTLYPFNNGIACGAGGNIQAYYYNNATYTVANGCGNGGGGNNTPWVIVRGYLYTVP